LAAAVISAPEKPLAPQHVRQLRDVGGTSGFATTDVGIKSEIYRNNQREMLVSAGVLWGIRHSGAQAVGADEPNSIQPGVFFGKGFGDLPDGLAWLQPFAVTGAFVDELPFGTTTSALGFNPVNGKLIGRRAIAASSLAINVCG
jgi:hypothetical protein